MKRVLLTGGCGNIGSHVVDRLLSRGYSVRVLDLETARNRRVARRWRSKCEVRFGSICDASVVTRAVDEVDHVVHLAAVVPPATDVDQALGYRVNVVGTRTLIGACEARSRPPRLTFTSTAAIWGNNDESKGPRRADEPISPMDNYTRQKAECEAMVRASRIDTVIFRVAMTPPVTLTALSPFVFEMHPDLRVEFTHPKDQALGIVNSLGITRGVVGETLLLGGGAHNRYRYREWLNSVFEAVGLPKMPRSAFGDALFLTDWVDSEQSQAILDYQRHDLAAYLGEVERALGPAKALLRTLGPVASSAILAYSPYYAKRHGRPARIPEAQRALRTMVRGIRAAKSLL